MALLLLAIAGSTTSTAQASNFSTEEESQLFLNNVAGFNITAYTIALTSNEKDVFDTLPRETTDFRLASSDSSFRATCTFLDNHLQKVFITEYSGEPKVSQYSTNTVESAKIFLQQYRQYFGSSDYITMGSILSSINSEQNTTTVCGNVKLTVSNINQSSIEYAWTYVDENGVPAPSKTVVLSYRNGLLRCFLDNWQFYSVASEPQISKDQATEIASNAISKYSTTVLMPDNTTKIVSGFKVQSIGQIALIYQNYREAISTRNGNPFMLYPTWVVSLGFDKIYEGEVSSAIVRVWADNGEVSNISPIKVGTAYVPVDEQPIQEKWNTAGSLLAVVSIGIVSAFCIRWKGSLIRQHVKKKQYAKFAPLLICLCVSSYAIAATVPGVGATQESFMYASLYGQLSAEVDSASGVSSYVGGLFYNEGYTVANCWGSGTVKSSILSNADTAEDNYDYVAVYHFGHMNGQNHYLDNNGVDVSYSDIGQHTTQGKHYFVFMWTCKQANDDTMAYAWTQDPYDGDHCFIGFSDSSPMLQSMSFLGWNAQGYDVVTYFYYYALAYGYSISDALDSMSYDCFVCSYYYSPLNMGFYTYWPENPTFPPPPPPGWYGGSMIVYGDANNYLI